MTCFGSRLHTSYRLCNEKTVAAMANKPQTMQLRIGPPSPIPLTIAPPI